MRSALLLTAGLVLAATLSTPSAGANGPCPRETPSGLKAEPVGEQLVVNGLPLQIRQVRSREPVETLLERTAAAWQDEGYAVRREQIGPWQVVAARGSSCHTTLQLRAMAQARADDERSVGFLGIGEPQRSQPRLPRDLKLQLPGQVEINSAVSADDAGGRSHTLTLSSRRSVAELNDYFLRHLTDRRWAAVQSHEVRGPGGQGARIVSAQKDSERLTLVIWRDELTRMQLSLAGSP